MAESYRWMARRRGPAAARAVALVNFVGAALRALLLWPLARARPQRFGEAQRNQARWARINAQGLRPRL
jgi:cobalamin biosynthesis protein CobD/CbiB